MKHLLALILILNFSMVFSQNQKIDSLQQEVNKAKGTDRILQLNELAIAYWDVDLKKSITLGKEALKLEEKYKFYKAKARTYNVIGVAYNHLNNFAKSDEYYNKSLDVSKTYGTDLDRMKSLCNKTANYTNGYRAKNFKISENLNELLELSLKKGEYELFAYAVNNIIASNILLNKNDFNILAYLESVENKADENLKSTINILYCSYYNENKQYFKSIEILKKTLTISNDKFVKYNCYMTLGYIYFGLKRFKESKRYYHEALVVYDLNKNNPLFGSQIRLYTQLIAVDIELRDFKEAYKFAKYPSLHKGFKETKDFICMQNNNLGLLYLGLDSLKKAEYYINQSLSLSDSIESKLFKLTALISKVEILKRQKKNNDMQKAMLNIAQIIDSVHDDYTIYEGYQQLTDYYKSTGDYKKSLHYLEKWAVVNDSLKSTESLQIFNEFQTKYETEKKEQQIVLQETKIKSQHRFLIVLSISGVLLLIVFAFIYILYNKRNQAYKQLVLQSIGKIDNEELFDESELSSTNNYLEVPDIVANQKNNNTLVDETTKNQIKEELQKQLSDKIYLDDSLSINKLATLCSTNRTYLSQVINETYQMNFNTFINKLRIDEAKKLLLDESFKTPLKHLSTQLGFNTYTVFNDAFKRFIGVTPAFFLKTVKTERGNNN